MVRPASRRRATSMAMSVAMAVAVAAVAAARLAVAANDRGPDTSRPCGTLDLSHPATQHCFPFDGSHHFVCCVDIQAVDNEASPHGNMNPLGDVIKAASSNSSYSWCTCSEEICEEQLRGRVAWNQNGVGWRGFRADPRRVRAYYTGTGGGEGHSGL
ncbi:hypothetical protein MMPV_000718 [Pyropia vietnamensis]